MVNETRRDLARATKTGTEYELVATSNNRQEAKCIMCNGTVTVPPGYVGVVAIKQHKMSDSHTSNYNAVTSKSINDKKFRKANTRQDIVIVSEVAQIYHAVKHNLSCNVLDCSLKLNSKLYQDSKVTGKISCQRSKSEAIFTNMSREKGIRSSIERFQA